MFAQFLAQNYLNSLSRQGNIGLNSEWNDFYQSEPQEIISELNNTKYQADQNVLKTYIKKCYFLGIQDVIIKFNTKTEAAQALIEDCHFNNSQSNGIACINFSPKGSIAINRNTFNSLSYGGEANAFYTLCNSDFVYATSVSNCGKSHFIPRQNIFITANHKVANTNITKNICNGNAIGAFQLYNTDCWIGFSNFCENTQNDDSNDVSLWLGHVNSGFKCEFMFTNIMFNKCKDNNPLILFNDETNFRYCIIGNNTANIHFRVESSQELKINFIDCILQEYKIASSSGKGGKVIEQKVYGQIPPIVANPIELAPRTKVVYCTADAHYANLKRARQNYLYT